MKKLTTAEFIRRARELHGNKYDYSKVIYIDAHTKVIIICPIHGEFEQTATNHLRGNGCRHCSNWHERYTTEKYIEVAKEVHGDKYGYDKVEYVNNRTKIIIICPKHGEFEVRPIDFLNGHGCRGCYADRRREYYKEKRGREYFSYQQASEYCIKNQITTAIQFRDFYNKNKPKSLPSNPDRFYEEWVNWGTFLNTDNINRKDLKLAKEEIIKRARAVHGDRYGYSKLIYKGVDENIIITCFEHGDFPQTPSVHLNGSGCPKCANKRGADKRRKSIEVFIKEAKELHNDSYGYDNVEYLNANDKVFITCFEHGDFPQTPSSHLNGQGCPKCARSKRSANFLSYDEGKNFIRDFKIRGKREYFQWWKLNKPNFLPSNAEEYYRKNK